MEKYLAIANGGPAVCHEEQAKDSVHMAMFGEDPLAPLV